MNPNGVSTKWHSLVLLCRWWKFMFKSALKHSKWNKLIRIYANAAHTPHVQCTRVVTQQKVVVVVVLVIVIVTFSLSFKSSIVALHACLASINSHWTKERRKTSNRLNVNALKFSHYEMAGHIFYLLFVLVTLDCITPTKMYMIFMISQILCIE